LAAGGSVTVTVSINSNANSLKASQTPYPDTVSFINTTNDIGSTSRPVSLDILRSPAKQIGAIVSLLLDDSEEYLYVCDQSAKVVHKLNTDGIYKKKIGSGLLERAWSCLIDSKNNLLVADGSEFKIFSKDQLVGSFGKGFFAIDGYVFATLDSNGNIYAANFGWGFIEVFNKDYKHTNTIDVRDWLGDNGGGGFEGPIGIAYDPSDDSLIFTTRGAQSNDTGNFKITRSGSLIKQFGPSDSEQFDCRIADSGTLFIKDVTLFTNAVTLFNSNGDFIKKWVSVGNNPYGLAFDSEENIYVVVGPKSINVYKGTGASTPIRTITSPNFQKLGGMDILR
jgi:hypothetical protein